MRANHKTGRQSEGKMSGIWEKIKERLGFGRKAEGDKEDDRRALFTSSAKASAVMAMMGSSPIRLPQ